MLKRFYDEYVRSRLAVVIPIQFLHLARSGLLLIPPLLVRYLIDDVIAQKRAEQIPLLAGGALAIYALSAVVGALKSYYGHAYAQWITHEMRRDLYRHYQKMAMSFHDNWKTGQLISRVVDDLNVVQEFSHHGPEAVISSSALILGTGAILIRLNYRLALVALIFAPFLAVFAYYMYTLMFKRFRAVRQKIADLTDRLEDRLAGMKVIKTFVNEDFEGERFEESSRDHAASRIGAIKIMSIQGSGSYFLNGMALVTVLGYGGFLVSEGVMSVGTVAAFFFYFNQIRGPILRIIRMNEQLSRFFASIERFFDHIDKEPVIVKRAGDYHPDVVEGSVRLENVHFSYERGEKVLHGVNIEVEPNEMIALVGPSGAGKTTIVSLVPRLYEVDQGRVLVDGVDVREWNLPRLRGSMAMVMQDDYLFAGTVAENIAYGKRDATQEEVKWAAKRANAHEFIQDLPDQYATQIGQRGIKLSEGQRQRVSIARALLKNPTILILDEATSSVDTKTEQLIQQAVDRLTAGRTTFSIAHRLSTIIDADKIVFVENGRLKERGTHEELLAEDGRYAEFFRMQFAAGLEGERAQVRDD